jgi:6-phosphogluconate dehydrogenase
MQLGMIGLGRMGANAAAVDEGVPAPILSSALFGRFASRGNADYADRVLSAMRKQFGGHEEKKTGGS